MKIEKNCFGSRVPEVQILSPRPFLSKQNPTMITLYVLKGKSGKRYVGITKDLPRRLHEHRLKKSKGSQVLDDFFLLRTEEFDDYKAARIREKFLKSGQGRKWLDEWETLPESAKGG
jgi:putative endonuclease